METSSHFLPSGSVLQIQPPGASDAHGMAAGVPLPRQDEVFAPQPRHQRAVGLDQLGVIAGQDVERFAVRPQQHRVRPMFAAAGEVAKLFELVELIVAVGSADAIKAAWIFAGAIDDDVQAVERPEKALGLADIDVDRLDLGARRLPQRAAA